MTIRLGLRHRPTAIPGLVASYIVAAYWFTASTSFANPAVTLARSLTRTFAGIRPDDVAGFVIAQLLGALVAVALCRLLDVQSDGRRVARPCRSLQGCPLQLNVATRMANALSGCFSCNEQEDGPLARFPYRGFGCLPCHHSGRSTEHPRPAGFSCPEDAVHPVMSG